MTSLEQQAIDYIEDYASNPLNSKEVSAGLDWLEEHWQIGTITRFTYERLKRVLFQHFHRAS